MLLIHIVSIKLKWKVRVRDERMERMCFCLEDNLSNGKIVFFSINNLSNGEEINYTPSLSLRFLYPHFLVTTLAVLSILSFCRYLYCFLFYYMHIDLSIMFGLIL